MKIVVAYSGGLDTSIILTWLKEKYNAEIVAFCADIGQEEELKGLDKKALKTGASKCYIDDLTDEFAADFIYPMIRANALYENQYFLGTSIARPLIAKRMVEIARLEKADAVAHGATGKGNDQVRFELTFAALAPDLKIIAPWRDWDFKGRTDLIEYAKSKGIAVPSARKSPTAPTAISSTSASRAASSRTRGPSRPPTCSSSASRPRKRPTNPSTSNSSSSPATASPSTAKNSSPPTSLRTLNKLGGKHGIGRVDLVENRFVGMKSRGVYETPGGAILHFAHRQLETLTLDREVMHLRDSLIPRYSELVYYGFWFAPEREFLQAAVEESQKYVTGTVRLKLYKGNLIVAGRKSPLSLYNPDVATMEADQGAYNQGDATGFIRLNALRLRTRSNVLSRRKKK